ncbi:hypothetical protein MASR1M8_24620 [Thermomonas brevis]
MNWDPFQRAVLAELGHALYRPARQVPPGIVPLASDAMADSVPIDGAPANAALLARLARAAALAPAELLRHADIVAAAAGLHGDGRAKRALWPRLRALRRG